MGDMRIFAASLAVAVMSTLLPPAAYAQQDRKGPPTARTEAEQKNDTAIDQAYRQTLKHTDGKAKPANADPWQSIRPADGDTTKR